MRREKTIQTRDVGPIVYQIAECDHCGRGSRLDTTQRLIHVRQTGPLTFDDFAELDLCSVECLGRHFA